MSTQILVVSAGQSDFQGLIFPQNTGAVTAPTILSSAPTVEPSQPEVEPQPNVEPTPDEPAIPPTFVPHRDPGVEPAPACPEGSPDEGDDGFETCSRPH